MRKTFTSHASYIVRHVLRVPRQNKLSRPLVLAFSFLIVAVMHVVADPDPSVCRAWMQLRYYASVFAGIVLESVIISLWTRYTASDSRKLKSRIRREVNKDHRDDESAPNGNTRSSSSKWRWFGYLWVMAFHTWAASKLVYGTAHC